MPLDAQTKELLAQLVEQKTPAYHEMTPESARQFFKTMMASDGESVAQVENLKISGPAGDIPIRVYTPQGCGPFPVLVYLHGGGFVIGDLDTYDAFCRTLTNGVGCIVVAPDYRLAPEHKFPAAHEDCYAATKWAAANASAFNGDPSRIAVAGDSAGGNLTAVVAQMARDRGGPPLIFQLMIYPATDVAADNPSIRENAEGYLITLKDIHWFYNHYLNTPEEGRNPMASPLLAASLCGLPPALIITAEFDPLRDEGEQYGERLKQAGVPVTLSRYNGTIHGFVAMASVLDQGKQGTAECCAALRNAFLSKRAAG
jgi:acetyl esterase/lipase